MNPFRIVGTKYLTWPWLDEARTQLNPLHQLRTYAQKEGVVKVPRTDGMTELANFTDYEIFSVPMLVEVVSAGAEVHDYAAWVLRTTTELANEVPSYLPNAVDGEGTPYTWGNWHDAYHHETALGDDWIVPLNAWGDAALGSVIRQLVLDGYTVMNWHDVTEAMKLLPQDPV